MKNLILDVKNDLKAHVNLIARVFFITFLAITSMLFIVGVYAFLFRVFTGFNFG